MSNAWYRDARAKEGELKAFDAERAERRGNQQEARRLYREAAEAFAAVAIRVPIDHPNTRSNLAIAAVATFARAEDFARAVGFANRMLAEFDALSVHGRNELGRLAQEYASRLVTANVTPMLNLSTRKPTMPAGSRSQSVREGVRDRFRHPHRGAA